MWAALCRPSHPWLAACSLYLSELLGDACLVELLYMQQANADTQVM